MHPQSRPHPRPHPDPDEYWQPHPPPQPRFQPQPDPPDDLHNQDQAMPSMNPLLSTKTKTPREEDFFGAVSLSPRRQDPLLDGHHAMMPMSSTGLTNNTTILDSLASPCMPLTLRLVSATSLRAARKNFTSNPMCEISLVLARDGRSGETLLQSGRQFTWSATGNMQADSKALDGTQRSVRKGRTRSRSRADAYVSAANGVCSRMFRTPIVRSSLNPIWNFDADFGDVDATRIVGVLFVVRHVERMGLVKKDLGQVLVPIRELVDMRTDATPEKAFELQAVGGNWDRHSDEGFATPSVGQITLAFNSYGIARRTEPARLTRGVSTASLPPQHAEDSVAHEDDFTSGAPRRPSLHSAQQEVRRLQACHESHPRPGDIWYAINAQWITSWLLFVSKFEGDPAHRPGPIDNDCLLRDDVHDGRFHLRHDLEVKTDFRLINKASWSFFLEQYGGGPVIEISIPPSCNDTSEWIATMRLHEVAKVESNYLSAYSSEDAMAP